MHLIFPIKRCPVLAQAAGSVGASEMGFTVHILCAAGEAALAAEGAWWCLVEKMNGSVLVGFCCFVFFFFSPTLCLCLFLGMVGLQKQPGKKSRVKSGQGGL